jgi:hypothetical protein
VNSEERAENPGFRPRPISSKNLTRLKFLGLLLTLGGVALFSYFVYTEGIHDLAADIARFGFAGFAVILFIHFLRICARAWAWKLSVYEPYTLSLGDTIPGVVIGEALSSVIPLGILISGTSKAVAVRKRVPLVVGLSSVATENLFYSLVTSIFLIVGAFTLLKSFNLEAGWAWTIDALIGAICLVLTFLVVMVIRQWHFASAICEWLYAKGFGRRLLEHGRLQVRLFENLIYGFYRRYPRRFLPICGLETAFHALGVIEGLFILSRISETAPTFLSAFLLESVSRIITIVFKLVPFVIGVDEAGAQLVTETLAVGAGIGVTLAIIRKGRILFWTAVGFGLIVKRGLSFREISQIGEEN